MTGVSEPTSLITVHMGQMDKEGQREKYQAISASVLPVVVLVVAAVVPGAFNPKLRVPRVAVPVEGAPTVNRR